MQTRFNPVSSPLRFGGAKQKPAPLNLAGSEEIQAQQKQEDDAFQKQLTDTLKKSGSGKLTGSFVKDVEKYGGETSETKLFINDFKKYLPELRKQADDPTHPDNEYAKNFLRDYLRQTPPKEEAKSSSTGEPLQPTVYKP